MSDALRRKSADIREFESTAVVSELIQIAEYITHMREEIAALRANEMTRDRIPMAHEELGSVLAATAGATNRIMAAAESILNLPDGPEARPDLEEHVGTIFEACAFQDITGQRISKVVTRCRASSSGSTASSAPSGRGMPPSPTRPSAPVASGPPS